jgi:hypothetical protein
LLLTGAWLALYILLQSLLVVNPDPLRVPTQATFPATSNSVMFIMLVCYLFMFNTFDLTCRFFFMGSVAEFYLKGAQEYSPTLVPLSRMVYHLGSFCKGGLFLTLFAPFLLLQELLEIIFTSESPAALRKYT